jgi:hypothetical protein
MRTITLYPEFAGLMFKQNEENPDNIHEIVLDIEIQIDDTIGKKEYTKQLDAFYQYMQQEEQSLIELLEEYAIQDKIDLSTYSDTEWLLLNIENGNHKSIYDLEESDEDEAFSHLRKPLIKKEK